MVEFLTLTATGFAVFSAVMFVANSCGFRRAPRAVSSANLPSVSVLVPARNEAAGIERTLTAILANGDPAPEGSDKGPNTQGPNLEVIVLDDQSDDGTSQIVQRLAASDQRLRLISGQTLPSGWCGKQFACDQLAQAATHDELLFLDADVTLTSDAIRRAVALRQKNGAALLSGFPRQVVGSLGEGLLIPLIHVVLLTYLPFVLMRRTKMQSASAGCGQFFLTNCDDYNRAGGHRAIRNSLHDGVTLPRAYRAAGLTSDVFDAADIAKCRMYRGWSQTWQGLMKNAHEGIANPRLICPFTAMMTLGFVAPAFLVAYWLMSANTWWLGVSLIGFVSAYIPRLITAARFDRAWLATCLFPLSIVLFLALQWSALIGRWFGSQSQWRGRVYPATSSPS